MDQIEATALHLELSRIAASRPGKGTAVYERVADICRSLHADDPSPLLLSQLQDLQALIGDWVKDDGWQRHGGDPEVLREALIERIDNIAELTGVLDAVEMEAPPVLATRSGAARLRS